MLPMDTVALLSTLDMPLPSKLGLPRVSMDTLDMARGVLMLHMDTVALLSTLDMPLPSKLGLPRDSMDILDMERGRLRLHLRLMLIMDTMAMDTDMVMDSVWAITVWDMVMDTGMDMATDIRDK